jgi:hypothetical protein
MTKRSAVMRIASSTVTAAVTVALAVAVHPAVAAADEPPPPKKAAVVSPTISTLSFIDTILLPLGCSTGVGGVSSGAATVPGASDATGDGVAQATATCAQLSMQGGTALDQATGQASPFAALNPVANPAIGSAGDATENAGTTYGSSLAPLGPTIVALAADIRFFGGS